MKLIFLFLIIPLIQVTASTKAQTITINKQSISLTAVFEEIMNQTNYDFVYSEQQISKVGRINIFVTNASIIDVLDKCFQGQPLTYSVKGKNVIIEAKKTSLFQPLIDKLSDIDVQGSIVDETGTPLVGATVKVKGSTTSVRTDSQGRFFIQDVAEDAILIVSFIGYQTREIPASQNVGKIKLEPVSGDLQEIEINAGYYTVKDKERTGSISRVTSEIIGNQPVSNPLQALQGRVTGLQITQLTGVPGGGFSVQIRGRSSLNNDVGNDPLYIVDGVIYPSVRLSASISNGITAGVNPLSMINPSDIESMEILKDADATAIYGSRGANGVILITTKKGEQGALKINAAIKQSVSRVPNNLSLLKTPDYLEMRREALKNDGLTATATDYDINGTWNEQQYTDWQKELIGNNSNATTVSLNIAGGTEKSKYIIGANYDVEDTVFPGNFGFQRGGIHSSLNLGSATDKFNITFTANYTHAQSNLLNYDLTQFILLPPNMPNAYDEYGNLNWANNTVYNNPMALLLQTNEAGTDNFIGSINFNYKILENLNFKASLGYTTIKREELLKLPLASNSPAFSVTSANRISYFSDNYNNSIIAEPQITYNGRLGPGNFDTLIGLSFQENTAQIRTIKATTFNSDELMENIASASVLSTNELKDNQYRYSAIFARLNYNIEHKYILNVTGRRDGSSKFGTGRQFANFGAIGAAWIFSEEKLIKEHLPFLSFGKLRVSFGITGNDQIPDYGYLELWNNILSNGTYQGISTLTPSRLANPDFGWETTRKGEAALQLGFINNKLNVQILYYKNNSSNQLVGRPLPPSTGFNTIQSNLAAEVQNTGWEFESNIQIINKRDWRWSTSLNLTIPKNKLVSYPGLESSTNALNYVVGQPLYIRKIYNVRDIDSQTGLYSIEDKDGNGIINSNDRYLSKFIGQTFYGGLQNSISFKQLSLDFLIAFTKQNGDNYLAGVQYPPGYFARTGPYNNQPDFVLDRWQTVGDEASIQKFTTLTNGRISYLNAKGGGGLSIDDASYLRLKNIAISYRLPSKIASFLKISTATINLQGQNLYTVTKYKGLDPESQSMVNLPPLRTLLIGLNLTF